MQDETAKSMYESASERLRELIRQETEARNQITHWAPIVEQLARLAGERVPADVQNRISLLNSVKRMADEQIEDMGLTEAIRWVFKQPSIVPLTPTQVRDRLAEMGYDLEKYRHVMPPIHNTLKRMKEAGEIREVEGVGGLGRAFVNAK
jgi:hypothetical protein